MKVLLCVMVMVLFCSNPTLATEKRKLHPELSDPVLGDRAAVVEWAWSPQYAKRFGLPVQDNGLKDGALWLIGVKVEREQFRDYQTYHCKIAGLINNKSLIATPPGDKYMRHPSDVWIGGLPGQLQGADSTFTTKGIALQTYTPLQAAWWKPGIKKPEPAKQKSSITIHYNLFYRYFLPDLAYFELEGGCGYFENPEQFRNEIRFHEQNKNAKPNAPITKSYPIVFSIPDSLMNRIYPYIEESVAWRNCFARRVGGKSNLLRMKDRKRFGNKCEPITDGYLDR